MTRSGRALLYALAAYLLDQASRWSSKKVGCALVYHRVEHEPGQPLGQLVPVVSTEQFEAHARHLGRRYRVVPASGLAHAVSRRRRGSRYPVAITFDDDLASHADIAGPMLHDLGLPATFFLCGASLHGPRSFWWDRLQLAVNSGVPVPAVPTISGDRAEGLAGMAAHIEALPAPERAEFADELGRRLGSDPEEAGIRAPQVRSLAVAGFEIGFHTQDHDPLDALAEDELQRALTCGRAELADLYGAPLAVIAYPHGRADARVAAAARRAGYTAGFTTDGTPVRSSSDAMLLGRIDPSGLPQERFSLMLSRTFWAARPES